MDSNIIDKKNIDEFNNSGNEGRPLKVGFFNRLLRDFTAVYTYLISVIPSLGTIKSDTINEYTTASGVNIDGVLAKDGTLSAVTPLLTTAVATVSIKEYGDGHNIVDVITLTDFIVGHVPAAAAALGIGNIVAAFPAAPGFHVEEAYYQELQLKLPGSPVNADLGLGSVIATGAVSVLDGTGTFEDRLTGQTTATAATYGSLVKAMSRTALTGISVNLNNSVKDILLNAAGTWNVNNHSDLLAQGTIVIKWTKIV